MKKTKISLLFISAIIFSSITFNSCNFNLSETNYLTRPDVELVENGFRINGTYVSSDIDYINIYRQDLSTSAKNPRTERVAILYPKGDETSGNQNYFYIDKNIYKLHEYRYYVRFVTTKGEKNRTDWSEKKTHKDYGADTAASFKYDIKNTYYKFDSDNLTLNLSEDKDFTAPTVISDIAEYVPSLVFQAGDTIQVFELTTPNTTKTINLKTLLPQNFLTTDITLLGIVGQKKVYNTSGTTPILQTITWTDIAGITVKDKVSGQVLSKIPLKLEYGKDGYDYSITSDNEN